MEVFILFGYEDQMPEVIGVYSTLKAAREAREQDKDNEDTYQQAFYSIEGKKVLG